MSTERIYKPASIHTIATAGDSYIQDAAALGAMLEAMTSEFDADAVAWLETDQDALICRAVSGELLQPVLSQRFALDHFGASARVLKESGLQKLGLAHGAKSGVVLPHQGSVAVLVFATPSSLSEAALNILIAAAQAAVRSRAQHLSSTHELEEIANEIKLMEVVRANLASTFDVAPTMATLITTLRESFGWSWGAFWTWQERGGRMVMVSSQGDHPDVDALSKSNPLPLGEGYLGTSWERDEMQSISDLRHVTDDPRAEALADLGMRSALYIPVKVGEEQVAVLECLDPRPGLLSQRNLYTMRSIRQLISSRISQLIADRRAADLALLPVMAGVVFDALAELEDMDAIWMAVAESLSSLFWTDALAVVYEDDDGNLQAASDDIDPARLTQGARDDLLGRCFAEKGIVSTATLGTSGAWSARMNQDGYNSFIALYLPCTRHPPVALLIFWQRNRLPNRFWRDAFGEIGRLIAQVCDQVVVREEEKKRGQSVERIMGLLNELAEGEIDARITMKMPGNLEKMKENVHRIAEALCGFRAAIKSLTDDCAAGELSRRADASRFTGAYQEIIAGTNRMLDVVAQPIQIAVERLGHMAQGVNVVPIKGSYDGDFRRLVDSINTLLATDAHIVDLAERISQGDLSLTIRPRSREDRLMTSLARMVENLERFQGVIDGLIRAFTCGDLGARADEIGFSGSFRAMIGGMNHAVEAVAGPTQEAIAALTSIARGEQLAPLQGDYQGDFMQLTSAINTLLVVNGEIVNLSERIAQGDLTVEVELRSEDDRLLSALQQMIGGLNQALHQIGQTATMIDSGSRQVSSASLSVSENAVQAAESASKMKGFAADLRSRTAENAELATAARGCTREAASASEDGAQQMEQMLRAMQQIEEESSRIGNIVKVIDGIAFQTNLLALNAAVEAARAGTHGKGFAVVAEEVRNLATRSATAAREIGAVISTSLRHTKAGVSAAETSATALAAARNATREASSLVDEIAEVSAEQSQAIDAMHEGLNQLDQIVSSSSLQSNQMASAAHQMDGQIQEMRKMLERFHLKQPQHQGSPIPGLSRAQLQSIMAMVRSGRLAAK